MKDRIFVLCVFGDVDARFVMPFVFFQIIGYGGVARSTVDREVGGIFKHLGGRLQLCTVVIQ
jgi:hypothetical protein